MAKSEKSKTIRRKQVHDCLNTESKIPNRQTSKLNFFINFFLMTRRTRDFPRPRCVPWEERLPGEKRKEKKGWVRQRRKVHFKKEKEGGEAAKEPLPPPSSLLPLRRKNATRVPRKTRGGTRMEHAFEYLGVAVSHLQKKWLQKGRQEPCVLRP